MKEKTEYSTHREIQEKLLDRIMLIFGIMSIPVLIFSVLRYFDIGWHNAFYINMAITAVMVLLAVFRKSIPYHIKTLCIITAFIILSLSGARYTGLSSFYIPFLMLAIFTGVIFLGRKPAFFIYLASAGIITAAGVLNVKGVIAPVINLNAYHGYYTSWLTALCTFSAITGLVILIVGEIGYLLSKKISELEMMNQELKGAVNEIKTLQGILPICAKCKKIRDSNGYWTQVESYIENHSELKFSHGICEKCSEELYSSEEWFKRKKDNK